MFTSNEQHGNSSPTPDAYDGSWLELLENPNASLPGREGIPDGSVPDAGSDGPLLGRQPVD